jgi:hypothetical protein
LNEISPSASAGRRAGSATVSVVLDGEERLTRAVEAPPEGRCGLWSKADSQVLFDDFTVGRPR